MGVWEDACQRRMHACMPPNWRGGGGAGEAPRRSHAIPAAGKLAGSVGLVPRPVLARLKLLAGGGLEAERLDVGLEKVLKPRGPPHQRLEVVQEVKAWARGVGRGRCWASRASTAPRWLRYKGRGTPARAQAGAPVRPSGLRALFTTPLFPPPHARRRGQALSPPRAPFSYGIVEKASSGSTPAAGYGW